MNSTRRRFVVGGAAAALVGPAVVRGQPVFRIVIVGGGFAGATCARYLKLWAPRASITLVEPQQLYYACPMSNRILAGGFDLRELARDYLALAEQKIAVVSATVTGIDAARRTVTLSTGTTLNWDRLVLAPGIEFADERVPGLGAAIANGNVLHAWRGGAPQITQLRERIADMRAGGVVALHIPKAPFRCPPGPYERASLIAHYLSRNNPKAKLLVFDSNPDILAKRELFRAWWKDRHPSLIEYVPNAELTAIADAGRTLQFRMQGSVQADVVNVVPPQRAPALLKRAGLVSADADWCPVDFRTYESTLVRGIHVIGDAIASAPGMPKSGHMANQTGKICAAAIAAAANGTAAVAEPVIANTCYSFVNTHEAIHVAGVYRYDSTARTMTLVKGTGGTSKAPNSTEALHAMAWVLNILHDTFGSNYALRL